MVKNSDLKKLLAKHSQNLEFRAGQNLYTYEEKADKIYFILSGLIRIFIKDKEQEIEVVRNKNGDFAGETALTAEKYSSRAEVYLDTKVLSFTVSDLRKIMKKNNNFANTMINNLSDYIENLHKKEEIKLESITKIDKKIKTEAEIKKTVAAEKKIKNKKDEDLNRAAHKIKKLDDFYLAGHSRYSKKAKKDDQYYLYEKQVKCPVCSTKMEIKKIRNSRLRINKIREDLRPIYKNFNLYYYSVLSCTNCLFTARRKDFFDFSKSKRKKIQEDFKNLIINKLGENFKIEYSNPRSINEVFDAHYLALKLYNFVDLDADKKAFLWRELSWIYEDLKEDKLAEKASLNALNNLKEFYFKENSGSKKESDSIILLLAVLYYKHDQNDKALPLLDKLIRDAKVNRRQKTKARDLFLKIRSENENK